MNRERFLQSLISASIFFRYRNTTTRMKLFRVGLKLFLALFLGKLSKLLRSFVITKSTIFVSIRRSIKNTIRHVIFRPRGKLRLVVSYRKRNIKYLSGINIDCVSSGRQYELKLAASDNLKENYTTVVIHVKDVNDNPPVFERPTYRTQITEEDDRNLPKRVLQVRLDPPPVAFDSYWANNVHQTVQKESNSDVHSQIDSRRFSFLHGMGFHIFFSLYCRLVASVLCLCLFLLQLACL